VADVLERLVIVDTTDLRRGSGSARMLLWRSLFGNQDSPDGRPRQPHRQALDHLPGSPTTSICQ
jgi:hypothetical protein